MNAPTPLNLQVSRILYRILLLYTISSIAVASAALHLYKQNENEQLASLAGLPVFTFLVDWMPSIQKPVEYLLKAQDFSRADLVVVVYSSSWVLFLITFSLGLGVSMYLTISATPKQWHSTQDYIVKKLDITPDVSHKGFRRGIIPTTVFVVFALFLAIFGIYDFSGSSFTLNAVNVRDRDVFYLSYNTVWCIFICDFSCFLVNSSC